MTATMTANGPIVEDALFGDGQVVKVNAGEDPDSACFCVCGCDTYDVKVTNSKGTSANVFSIKGPVGALQEQ